MRESGAERAGKQCAADRPARCSGQDLDAHLVGRRSGILRILRDRPGIERLHEEIENAGGIGGCRDRAAEHEPDLESVGGRRGIVEREIVADRVRRRGKGDRGIGIGNVCVRHHEPPRSRIWCDRSACSASGMSAPRNEAACAAGLLGSPGEDAAKVICGSSITNARRLKRVRAAPRRQGRSESVSGNLSSSKSVAVSTAGGQTAWRRAAAAIWLPCRDYCAGMNDGRAFFCPSVPAPVRAGRRRRPMPSCRISHRP